MEKEAIKSKFKSRFWILGILAVLLIAIGFVIFKTSDEQKHIAYVERLGGGVARMPLIPDQIYRFLPQQLRSYTPEGAVALVYLPISSISDAEIEPIFGYFPQLLHLDLSDSGVTDETLKKVSMHSTLDSVFLDSTSVTDAGVKELSKSKSITELYLDDTKITDESIVYLSQMKQLSSLSVSRTALTDKSVNILLRMPNLKFVIAEKTQISKGELQRLPSNGVQLR